jgi:hypothetical protein
VEDAREALLGSTKRLLGTSAVGEIARDDGECRSVLVPHREAARLGPAIGAVGADEADGAGRGRPRGRDDAEDAAADDLAIFGMDQIEHRPAEQLVARFVAEEGHERGVGVGDRAAGERAVREDAVGDALHQLPVVGERATVRLLGA